MNGSIQYTYHSDVNDHFSLIDHFVCSSLLVKDTKSTTIMVDGNNTSDHLAISVAVEADGRCTDLPQDKDKCLKFQWEKVDPVWYSKVLSGLSQVTIPVEALSCTTTGCQDHYTNLESYYLELITCLQIAAEETVPKTRVNFHKHCGSEELNKLKQVCIDATNLWRHYCCPRAGDINVYCTRVKLNYKNAVKMAAQNA